MAEYKIDKKKLNKIFDLVFNYAKRRKLKPDMVCVQHDKSGTDIYLKFEREWINIKKISDFFHPFSFENKCIKEIMDKISREKMNFDNRRRYPKIDIISDLNYKTTVMFG